MKQFNKEEFLEFVRTWSKKHNIIGAIEASELLDQAFLSLDTLPKVYQKESVSLVDVGAGPGWMAVAWLLRFPRAKALAIEPDPKCSSFLCMLISMFPILRGRFYISDSRFEHVSRETTVGQIGTQFFLVSRAFSPADKLDELYKASEFRRDPLFLFFCEQSLPQKQIFSLKLKL